MDTLDEQKNNRRADENLKVDDRFDPVVVLAGNAGSRIQGAQSIAQP
jgi:hypothetical protein